MRVRYESKRQRELNATRRWCIMAAFTSVAVALWVLIESNSSIKNLNLKTSSQFYNSLHINHYNLSKDLSDSNSNLNSNHYPNSNSNQQINLIIYDAKTTSEEETQDGVEQTAMTTTMENSNSNSNLNSISNLSLYNNQNFYENNLDFNFKQYKVFVENVEGTEVMYEKAIFSSEFEEKNGNYSGIFFVAHGCKHSATDFWPKSEECEKCLGLPEFVKIRQIALSLNFVFVAISSSNRESNCWDVQSLAEKSSSDAKNVKKALNFIIQKNNWENLKIFAMGSSSGGEFVLYLSQIMHLSGICMQNSAPKPADLNIIQELINIEIQQKNLTFPPIVFVHMVRDTVLSGHVQDAIKLFNESSIQNLEIQVQPKIIDSKYFFNRINGMKIELSEQIYLALKNGGQLDENGYLLKSPKKDKQWKEILNQKIPDIEKIYDLEDDVSPINEELNIAWAEHQIISDYTLQILQWFQNITSNSTSV